MKATRVHEYGEPEVLQFEEMPLADAVQAHHDVIELSTHGKIVLVP